MNIKMDLNHKRKSVIAVQNLRIKREKLSSSEDSGERDGLLNEAQNKNPLISWWPQNDLQTLLARMEAVLPKNDKNIFRYRLTKLDWEKIQFGNYSKDDCRFAWLAIQNKLSTFKTLGHLVNDAKILLATKGIDMYQSKQNCVKKPMTAYVIYFVEVLPIYKKKHPNLTLAQLTPMIANEYRSLSPAKKQCYFDKAQKQKSEYQEFMDKMNVDFKLKAEPKEPPVNNYCPFIQDIVMTQSNPLASVHPKDTSRKWKSFSDEKRQMYTDRLKVPKERHKTEYGAYLKTLAKEERPIGLPKIKAEPKKTEPKVVRRIDARETITKEPEEKSISKRNATLELFENEPKPVLYENAFELYRSKIRPNEKHTITSLEDWEKRNGRIKDECINELRVLKKEYLHNLKIYICSLSEDDLKAYVRVRKPELLIVNTYNDGSDDSLSGLENTRSSWENNEKETDDDDTD